MKILIDTHTHTVASGHAYSTLRENAILAKEKGLDGFVCTDHARSIEFAIPEYIIGVSLAYVPDVIEGVRMFKGIEANIIDYTGGIDVEEYYLKFTEFAIASLHTFCIESGGKTKNTEALIGALNNPYVDVIGHSGNPSFPIDAQAYVLEVAKLGKLVEVNNQSFRVRKGCYENCAKIIQLCKKHDVCITVASDAHSCYNVGDFDNAIALLKECEFPNELIINSDMEKFSRFIEARKKRISNI